MARIGVLECDHVDQPFRAVAGGDYFGMFERLLPTLDLVPYDVVGGAFPAGPDECDGWILTGSRRSAYEPLPWIDRLGAFARAAVAAARPTVGICFGHQLLAHATGGLTTRAEQGWGVGAHALSTGHRLLYSHQDQVVALPPTGGTLASTDHCPNAVIAVGDHALGIQGHPEFSAAYLAALIEARVDRIGEEVVDAALASLEAPCDEAAAAAWMADVLTGGRAQDVLEP